MAEIHELSALELRAAYQACQLSPVDVLDAIFARIDQLEPTVHAFVTETRALARSQARDAEQAWMSLDDEEAPPLLGIPITMKDLVDVEGVLTTMGSLVTSREPALRDELFVRRLRDAGAVILGKTNTSEFGLAAQTMNRVAPTTTNPWNVERTAGGSSGGAAAACAAGFGPLHHGTDGGGSVRVPAAYCGVVGLKPTGRRIPRRVRGAGMSQISTDGVLARSLADAAMMLGVIAGPDRRDPAPYRSEPVNFHSYAQAGSLEGVRVAWTTDLAGPTPCEPLIESQVVATAQALGDAGANVSHAGPDIANPQEIFPVLSAVGAASNYAALCQGREDELSNYTRSSLRRGLALTGAQVAEVYAKLDKLQRRMESWFDEFDALLTPTSAIAAHEHGTRIDEIAGQPVNPWMISILYTPLANLLQAPAIAMPAGLDTDGLPVSVQVMAKEGDDATAIRCAAVLEEAGLGGASRLAPV